MCAIRKAPSGYQLEAGVLCASPKLTVGWVESGWRIGKEETTSCEFCYIIKGCAEFNNLGE